MPYGLKKKRNVDAYWVYNKETGHKYSVEPLPKNEARAQLRAIYATEARLLKGKGEGELEGEGFKEIWNAGKQFLGKIVNKAKRDDYPPKMRDAISKVGNLAVNQLYVRREPISSWVSKAINFITQGKWNVETQKANYDEVFHLSLEVVVDTGSGIQSRWTLEKNEVLNLVPSKAYTNKTQIMIVPLTSSTTINTLLSGVKSVQGDELFRYDAVSNNCQRFVADTLSAAGLLSPEIKAFVVQPMEAIFAKLPSYAEKIVRGATDLGSIVNHALEGGYRTPLVRQDVNIATEHHNEYLVLTQAITALRRELDNLEDRLENVQGQRAREIIIAQMAAITRRLLSLVEEEHRLFPIYFEELERLEEDVERNVNLNRRDEDLAEEAMNAAMQGNGGKIRADVEDREIKRVVDAKLDRLIPKPKTFPILPKDEWLEAHNRWGRWPTIKTYEEYVDKIKQQNIANVLIYNNLIAQRRKDYETLDVNNRDREAEYKADPGLRPVGSKLDVNGKRLPPLVLDRVSQTELERRYALKKKMDREAARAADPFNAFIGDIGNAASNIIESQYGVNPASFLGKGKSKRRL